MGQAPWLLGGRVWGAGSLQLWGWRLMTARGEQAVMFRRDLFNPLAHGLNGKFQ